MNEKPSIPVRKLSMGGHEWLEAFIGHYKVLLMISSIKSIVQDGGRTKVQAGEHFHFIEANYDDVVKTLNGAAYAR